MVWEPRPQPGFGLSSNPYQGRWRGWYSAIADWQLANPGRPIAECAKALGKHPNTVSLIASSDMYRDYFARRREEWTREHDFALINKTTRVAEMSLDLMIDKMEKQGDKIPMNIVTGVATSALDRLGYAPKTAPSVEVNVNQDNRKVVMVPISAGALEEARDAIRAAEQARAVSHREHEIELEAEPSAEESGASPSKPPHRS